MLLFSSSSPWPQHNAPGFAAILQGINVLKATTMMCFQRSFVLHRYIGTTIEELLCILLPEILVHGGYQPMAPPTFGYT